MSQNSRGRAVDFHDNNEFVENNEFLCSKFVPQRINDDQNISSPVVLRHFTFAVVPTYRVTAIAEALTKLVCDF